MQFRKSFLPHTVSDIACFLLLFSFIPITFIFELYVVLPAFHDTDGFIYKAYWVLGLFVVFNLKGNLLATMLVDTSIRTTILRPPVKPPLRKLWRYCDLCEALSPPRSWHCQICRTCVLKRDHHCMFAGCCIGHHNHRYFFYIVIYLLIGSTVATIYNSLYFWWLHVEIYARISTIWKLLFPLFIFTFDVSWSNMHLFIYEMCLIGMLYSLLLLCYHLPVILRGCVVHEVSSALPDKYNEGRRMNLQMILGKRMYLTWLAPFVKSPLPHDGAHWEPQLPQTSKNR